MLAMNYRGPYRVRAVHKAEPEIEHPNDAIVRVTRSCICGSDIHIYNGLVPDTRVGQIVGHEFTGVVEEVGPSVQNLKVGDRVLVPFNIFCGSCYFCQKELYGNCHNVNSQASAMGGFYGYTHTAGGYDGGQAELVRVPFADVGPTVIPDDIHIEDAVLLTDAFPTGYQAAEMGDIGEGDTVVVFGAGPVGLFAAKSAWFFGAGRVIVVDREEYRLEFARRFAHCETVNFTEVDDMATHLKKMTDWMGADVCIDAVGCDASGSAFHTFTGKIAMLQGGSAIALHWAINSVRKGGRISIVGVYGQVSSIELFATTLLHPDQSRVIIPNRKIVGEILHNHGTIRQLELTVGVSYATDLPKALGAARETLLANSRVLKTPAPMVGITSLGDSAITLALGPWVAVPDYAPAQGELYQSVVERFRTAGIEMPFPQREVRLLGAA
jgi:threonine dehydrogenase-like Zn-dependent dehydrogenase